MAKLPHLTHLLVENTAVGPEPPTEPYDWRFLRHLAYERRVVGIPASPFLQSAAANSVSTADSTVGAGAAGSTNQSSQQIRSGSGVHSTGSELQQLPPLGRFAFCKLDGTLEEATRRLMDAPRKQ